MSGILIFVVVILFVTEWLGPVILLSIPTYWAFRALNGDTDAIVGLAFLLLALLPFTRVVREYMGWTK